MIELQREDAATLYEIYERALGALTEAEALLLRLPTSVDQKNFFFAHGEVIGAILSKLRAPLVLQYPELDTVGVDEEPPDTLSNDEAKSLAESLTDSQVRRIDELLLADCVSSWRKVARIVGTALIQAPEDVAEVPAGYYAHRVKCLVGAGRLESQGDLDYMRFSEVRLVQ